MWMQPFYFAFNPVSFAMVFFVALVVCNAVADTKSKRNQFRWKYNSGF